MLFNLIGLKLLDDKYPNMPCNIQIKSLVVCDHADTTSETPGLLSFMSSDLLSDPYCRMHHITKSLNINHFLQQHTPCSCFKSTEYLKNVKLPKYISARQSFKKYDMYVTVYLTLQNSFADTSGLYESQETLQNTYFLQNVITTVGKWKVYFDRGP